MKTANVLDPRFRLQPRKSHHPDHPQSLLENRAPQSLQPVYQSRVRLLTPMRLFTSSRGLPSPNRILSALHTHALCASATRPPLPSPKPLDGHSESHVRILSCRQHSTPPSDRALNVLLPVYSAAHIDNPTLQSEPTSGCGHPTHMLSSLSAHAHFAYSSLVTIVPIDRPKNCILLTWCLVIHLFNPLFHQHVSVPH